MTGATGPDTVNVKGLPSSESVGYVELGLVDEDDVGVVDGGEGQLVDERLRDAAHGVCMPPTLCSKMARGALPSAEALEIALGDVRERTSSSSRRLLTLAVMVSTTSWRCPSSSRIVSFTCTVIPLENRIVHGVFRSRVRPSAGRDRDAF